MDGSAGPALCMYNRDRLKGRRRCFCVFLWEGLFASLDCFKCLLFLCFPLSHHSSSLKDSRLHPGICAVSHASKPPPLLPSSLAPASRWLTVETGTLHCHHPVQKHKQRSPPSLTLPHPSNAPFLCLSPHSFV